MSCELLKIEQNLICNTCMVIWARLTGGNTQLVHYVYKIKKCATVIVHNVLCCIDDMMTHIFIHSQNTTIYYQFYINN